MEHSEILPLAQRCPALSGLSETALTLLCQEMQVRDLGKAELLYEQGDHPEALYFILEGTVELFLPWGDEDLLLVNVEVGELFGEAEYFENSPRTASARTTEGARLLVLPMGRLPHLFEAFPELYPTFVAQRLSDTSKRFRQSLQRSRRAERSLQHLNQFLELNDLSVLSDGSEGLIRRIVHMASKVMKADRATLFLVDHETGNLWSKVALGEGTRTLTVQRGEGLAGYALEHDEILNLPDVYEDPRFNRETDRRTGYRTKSMLCGPVKNGQGDTVGVIQVINKLFGDFDDEDIALFRAFAYQAAVAVDNYFLYDRLHTANERMTVMLDVLNAVTQTRNMAALIGKVIEKTITIIQCERASFFVHDEQKAELWSLKATGDNLEEIRFPADTGIAGACLAKKNLIIVPKAYDDPRFNATVDQKTGFRTRNLLAAPVLDRNGKVIAVVEAINSVGPEFEVHDQELLSVIASQLGEALKKAALLDELHQNNQGLSTQNFNLERTVEARSAELEKTNAELHRNILELKQLNERKSEFLGIAAHDLRNPLANISQITEILSEHLGQRDETPLLEPAQEVEFIQMIHSSATGMLQALEEIMNTESLDSGAPELKCEQVDLAGLCRRVVEMNQPNAEKKAIHLSLTVAEDEMPANVDPRRWREICDNLVSNAIKYSPEGKRVWISLSRLDSTPPRLRLTVKDEGPGMQASDLKEVFGKFKKLSARPTAGESSSGLGLYIVKKLAELHGGRVWVESVLGEGATFCVEIPA